MKKQMELFEPVEGAFDEGGLMDEGGSVDPVSGNDVPVGSTQEEVRDDIPAQLSEGEFVLPADVVRFIGLEKIMALRDEAKAGLARMEAMGQMGNSEEATIPDGIPFDINDLDMEDDGVLEYNTGGMVQGQGFTGVGGYQPSQFANYQSQYNPYQQQAFMTTPAQGYVAPMQQPTPVMPQMQTPTFEQMTGSAQPQPGGYDEFKTYVNDAGMEMQIPFKGGEPIYPIPEGYKLKTDEVQTAQTTTTTGAGRVAGQTTTTSGDDAPPQSREEIQVMKNRIDAAKRLGIVEAVNPFSIAAITGQFGKEDIGKFTNTGMIIGKDGVLLDPLTGKTVEQSSPIMIANIIKAIASGLSDEEVEKQKAYSDEFFDAMPDNAKDVLGRGLGKEARDTRIEEAKQKREEEAARRTEDRRTAAQQQAQAEAERREREELQRQIEEAQKRAREQMQQQYGDDDNNYEGSAQQAADQYTASAVAEAVATGDYSRGFADGGLVKQMEKSGLTPKK